MVGSVEIVESVESVESGKWETPFPKLPSKDFLHIRFEKFKVKDV